MKRFLSAMLGATLVAVALLAGAGQASAAQTSQAGQATYGGVSFSYPISLADSVAAETLPSFAATADSPYWLAHPQEIKFTFNGFRGAGNSLGPAIYVFPVQNSYQNLQTNGKDLWLDNVNKLQRLIAEPPDKRQLTTAALPFLPPTNSANMLVGKVSYLKFQNGEGFRALVHMSQGPGAPSANDTIYLFQGLTNDGRYYVSAMLGSFPSQPPAIPQQDANESADAYSQRLATIFDAIADSAYSPGLDKLDEMVQSLQVAPTTLGVEPGMPSTGGKAQTDWLLLAAAAISAMVCGIALRRWQYRR